MESSEHSTGDHESDSFYAIGGFVESSHESPPPEEEIISIENYNPIYLVVILYFILPIFLIFCAMSTTSFFGLVFLVLMIFHLLFLIRCNNSYTGIMAFLYFEILFSLLIFIVSIINSSDQDLSIPSQILGVSYQTIITSTPGFAIFATFCSVVFESIPISLMSHTPIFSFNKCRLKLFRNKIIQYIIDLIHTVSIAFLASTNMSYIFYPLLLYYLYSNITLALCGREVVPTFIFWTMEIYTLLYSLFEFYMVSFIGEVWNPSKMLMYQFIAPDSAKAANIVFSSFLVYSSTLLMTGPGWIKGETKDVPHILQNCVDVFIVIFYFGLFIFSLFFPNYLTLLWLIILFTCSFSSKKSTRQLFFPFLTFIYSISFVTIAISVYDCIPHPIDDGTDQPFSFMKLFGVFKYLHTNDAFGFNCGGFCFLAIIGQIGRIKHVKYQKVFHKFHKYDKIEDISETNVKMQIQKAKRDLFFESFIRRSIIFITSFYNLIYKIITFFSLPSCCVIAIYCGFYDARWTFQLITVLFLLIILLFMYFRWTFQIVKFLSAIIILISTFYKSSDSYDCRKTENYCLYFGYFQYIEESGFAPTPDDMLHAYLWPITFIFLDSVFITNETKSLQIYYSPYIVYFLYICISVCDIIYVFIFELSVFSLIYLILGCMIIGALVLRWRILRTFLILLSFIAYSVQLGMYTLSQHEEARDFINSHISQSVINIMQIIQPAGKIILLAIMLFMCSIVFYGKQKLYTKKLVFHILQEIRKIMHDFYFLISWILAFGFSLANNYPTLIKFFLLIIFLFGSVSSRFFYCCRYPLLLIFVMFLVCQSVFHLFVFVNIPESTLKLFRYIGLYLTADDLTSTTKNDSLGWQFAFILLNVLNLRTYTAINHPKEFLEKKSTRFYNGLCAMLHSWLPVLVQLFLVISTTFNKTIFGWITFIILLTSCYRSNFFSRSSATVTVVLNIFFLLQYLMYLGFPAGIFEQIPKWSIIDYFDESVRIGWEYGFQFFGVYNVEKTSLQMIFISAFICTFYLQFKDTSINYRQRYSQLPQLTKDFVDYVVLHIFEISTMLILVIASLLTSIDGLIFFVVLSFFYIANLLYDFNQRTTMAFISSYTFIIIALRVFSRLPVFVTDDIAIYMKRCFDLPFNEQSASSGKWIAIFVLYRLCHHIMNTNIYKEQLESHTKHCAYRFIRECQLKIIEKLDQDILLKNRTQEINALNSRQSHEFNVSDANTQLLNAETRSTNQMKKKENTIWYYNIYNSYVVPFLNRFVRLMASSVPINNEDGINVLTLESLTLLMKRCLGHYERNQEFHLEERERQFLISLPPSFQYQYSSISHLLDTQPIVNATEYFLRYFFFLIRKMPLIFLVFTSVVFLYIKPYIFGIIIFVFVVSIFCSLDFKGFVNVYRIFLVIVMIILGFRTISRTDMIIDRLISISGSLTNLQNRISTLSLIGMEPDFNIGIEIVLFVASAFFIIDQMNGMKIFPANYYYEKFIAILPGFPTEYCYGIMDDPVRNLGMNIPQTRTFYDSCKMMMSRTWLRTTNHHAYMTILDIISITLLLSWWTVWENGDDQYTSREKSYIFRVNALFVFILIVHTFFCLVVYYCCLGDMHFTLLWTETAWLVYEFSMIFFYIRSKNRAFPSTAKFYIFIRILQHLLAAHKCFIGRTYISYRYPRFATEWKQIRFVNKLIRFFPFVFEIQSVLQWIGKPTYVSLNDFCIIRDIELQLEILICNQFDNKNKEKTPNKKSRICGSITLLAVFIVVMFIPLLFLVTKSEGDEFNRVVLANLQAGIGGFPLFYEANGVVHTITNTEHQELADSNDKSMVEIAGQIQDTLYIINFPSFSSSLFQLSGILNQKSKDMLADNSSVHTMYFKLSISFEKPTTPGNILDVNIIKVSENINHSTRMDIIAIMNGENRAISSLTKLPRVIYARTKEEIQSLANAESHFKFFYSSETWSIALENSTDLEFMNNADDYILLVYSQPVPINPTAGLNESTSGTFIGVYILMLIVLGVVAKEFVCHQIDNLWRKKMEHPIKLYRMVVAINMFKNAGDIQTEKEMSDKFIKILKDQEKAMEITSTEN